MLLKMKSNIYIKRQTAYEIWKYLLKFTNNEWFSILK